MFLFPPRGLEFTDSQGGDMRLFGTPGSPFARKVRIVLEEKRAVGAVWASRSGGRCLFVMPTDGDFSSIARAIKS